MEKRKRGKKVAIRLNKEKGEMWERVKGRGGGAKMKYKVLE